MPGKGRPFEPGNTFATGGARPGSGRPPNEFRKWLGDILHSPKARARFEKIINDEENAEEKVTDQGVCVPTRARAQTYLQALELGWSYLESKSPTELNVNTSELADVPTDLIQALVAAFEGGQAGPTSSGVGATEGK